MILIIGDTVKAAQAYNELMPADASRTVLVDTFKDEAEETLRVAEALGDDLMGFVWIPLGNEGCYPRYG